MFRQNWLLSGAAAAVLISSFSAFQLGQSTAQAETQSAVQTVSSPPVILNTSTISPAMTLDEDRGVATMAPLLEATTPAVVNIAVETRVQARMGPLMQDPFFRRFFDMPDQMPEQRRQSAGSGVIVDAGDGYILTNHHVVDRADSVTVTLKDGRRFDAELVGSDDATDIALLKIEADNLTALSLATETDVRTGDYVVAIGNPFGLGQTVTSGIVSAVGRSGLNNDRYENFIQTDAPINPGNSGGALINSKGELIGINTAIIAPSGGNVGIGFAVPMSMAKNVMDQLIEHGEVKRGRIGVTIQTVTPDLAEALDLKVTEGAIVSEVIEGSPSDEAGIKAGDVIISVNDNPITSSTDLRNTVGLTPTGEKLEVTLMRNGKERRVDVGIDEVQNDTNRAIARLDGARFGNVPDSVSSNTEGAYVLSVQPGSQAWRAGLRDGDVIREVNRRPVESAQSFEDAVSDNEGVLALTIERGSAQVFLVLR